jgi:hypothetical protein
VSANFVPVAVNLYKIREAKDAAGDLFRSVRRQKMQYQGIWIVSPEGKVLAAHHEVKDRKNWTAEVLATIEESLAAFGLVETRLPQATNPLPFRGRGIQADGSISLAIYTRYMRHVRRDNSVVAEGLAVVDSLVLSASQWAVLSPPDFAVGTEWTLPDAVARRFCRVLSPASDQSTMPRPNEVASVEIKGKVIEVHDGMAQLEFSGQMMAEHHYLGKISPAEARFTGTGSCDVASGHPRSLLWVFDGIYRNFPPYDQPRKTAAVVEWHAADY